MAFLNNAETFQMSVISKATSLEWIYNLKK